MWYDKLKVLGNVLAAAGVTLAAVEGCGWCAIAAVSAKIAADLVKSVVLAFGK